MKLMWCIKKRNGQHGYPFLLCRYKTSLCLCGVASEIHRQLRRLNLYRTKVRFVLLDIVLQSTEKPLCMFGGKYYPRLHLRLRQSGHYPYEIEYKFRRRMSDYSKVSVCSLCYRFVQFNIQLVVILCHSYSN